MGHLLLLFLVSVVISGSLSSNVCYVKSGSSPVRCPSQPCLTIDQYAQQAKEYFTAGTSFVFLAGNHSLSMRIDLKDSSDITFKLDRFDPESDAVVVVEGHGASIVCKNVSRFRIEGLRFMLHANNSTGFSIFNSGLLLLSKVTFLRSGSISQAIEFHRSNATINGCNFVNNVGSRSGAVSATDASNVTIIDSNFTANTAQYGGAVYAERSVVSIKNSHFEDNTVQHGDGGAIFARESEVTLERNFFTANRADSYSGGAVYAPQCNITLMGNNFTKNTAQYGGAVYALGSNITSKQNNTANSFIRNLATVSGGALYLDNCTYNITNNRQHCVAMFEIFLQNFAYSGGGIALVHSSNAEIYNANFTGNSGSAVYSDHSKVSVSGMASFSKNNGYMGGGIVSAMSAISISGLTVFEKNIANYGGAVGGLESTITLSGNVVLQQNSAKAGGALFSSGTDVTFSNTTRFVSNSARYGGAMYFNNAATLTLKAQTNLTMSSNNASRYGGVIYHDDSPTLFQCDYAKDPILFEFLPPCFIRLSGTNTISTDSVVHSYNNSAEIGGNFLFGGLLDKCLLDLKNDGSYTMDPYGLIKHVFHVQSETDVNSEPFYLPFCENDSPSRFESLTMYMYRGQEFNVSLAALEQGNVPTSTSVTAKVASNARLGLNQSMQTISAGCNSLSYTLYSVQDQERLLLYVDGPCRDTGVATATVDVIFRPCPDAFIKNHDRCVCDKRLQEYGAECVVGEPSYAVRKAGSRFWMSALYNQSSPGVNQSYQGLILSKACPKDYCTSDSVNITLDNLDIQCDLNRSGVLCGACVTNYSLMLGSSKCQVCSNTNLILLIPFAAAGIALVVFLSVLRLTVATGMINGLIIYANIIQVNKHVFLPTNHTTGFMAVFIAWLNLDLGIETCFYDGMDAYTQTWLQFAFPLYVWIILGLIVLTSRYSLTVSRLIGSNPIAVLATLLLMSYAKILKIVIAVYSFTYLEYPHSMSVRVWINDANVPYLHPKHLVLVVVTSLVLVCLFLPYTLLLLLSHKFYRYSDRKCFLWLNRIKPLLDSYYAPYKFHTRYWTGFMLLVRCALYIELFLGTAKGSLLAISITFTIIGLASGYLRMYTNFYTNIVETFMYLNLVILSTATLADANGPALVNCSVGVTFVIMIGIFVYHFHINYTVSSTLWSKLRAKYRSITNARGVVEEETSAPLMKAACYNPLARQNSVTQSFVSVREPLLEF